MVKAHNVQPMSYEFFMRSFFKKEPPQSGSFSYIHILFAVELAVVELGVEAVSFEELGVGTLFHDVAVAHNED